MAPVSRIVGIVNAISLSQGSETASSSKLYSVFAGNGTLSWDADMSNLLEPEGTGGESLGITDVVFNNPGVIVTSAYAPGPQEGRLDDDELLDSGGRAVEWFVNGTFRWYTTLLKPAPAQVAGSTEFMAVLVSSPEEGAGGFTIYGISRETGEVAWVSSCRVRCLIQVRHDCMGH